MRRIRILGIAVAASMLLAIPPATADSETASNILSTNARANFSDGHAQRVEVSVGESAGGTVGDEFHPRDIDAFTLQEPLEATQQGLRNGSDDLESR